MLKEGFYSTNLGVLHYDKIWFELREEVAWEPVVQDDVTSFEFISEPRKGYDCAWRKKADGGLQLTARKYLV